MASVEVAQFSIIDFIHGLHSSPKDLSVGVVAYVVLAVGTAAKAVLFVYCKRLPDSDSVAALAEDHLNDVFSNIAAIAAAAIAANVHGAWWVDPIGEQAYEIYVQLLTTQAGWMPVVETNLRRVTRIELDVSI